jgi:hypothetical protein
MLTKKIILLSELDRKLEGISFLTKIQANTILFNIKQQRIF